MTQAHASPLEGNGPASRPQQPGEQREAPARAGCFPAGSNYPAGNFTSLLPARPRVVSATLPLQTLAGSLCAHRCRVDGAPNEL